MLIRANRAVSRTAFYAPNTGTIGSYPTRSMDVYAPIFVHPADVQTFIRVEPSTRELYKIFEKKTQATGALWLHWALVSQITLSTL